jgi:hypothetical protein
MIRLLQVAAAALGLVSAAGAEAALVTIHAATQPIARSYVVSNVPGFQCELPCTGGVPTGTELTLVALPYYGSYFQGWLGGTCSGGNPCTFTVPATDVELTAAMFSGRRSPLTVTPAQLTFGPTSIDSTSEPQVLTVGNDSAAPAEVIVGNSPDFLVLNGCTTLEPGDTCTIVVQFTPRTFAGNLGATRQAGPGVSLGSPQAIDPVFYVDVSGTAEKSFVRHFYRFILQRAPDAGGAEYWNGEGNRLSTLGLDPSESWAAMATVFFTSPEYVSLARTDDEFITDIYATVFNRAPDAASLAFWRDNFLTLGLTRRALLTHFLLSPEFLARLGFNFEPNPLERPEGEMILDFYRGLLGRMPDTSGFVYWLVRFREAQCRGGQAVVDEANAISAAFIASDEFKALVAGTNDPIAPLYDAFMRRGADAQGYVFWRSVLQSGQLTLDQVRVLFASSPEFQARVNAVTAALCFQ